MIDCVLARKNPVDWMMASTSARPAAARSAGLGYLATAPPPPVTVEQLARYNRAQIAAATAALLHEVAVSARRQ